MIDVGRVNEILAQWDGAKAIFSSFGDDLVTLLIVLERHADTVSERAQVRCYGCERVSLPVRWLPANLRVKMTSEGGGILPEFVLHDLSLPVEVICRKVSFVLSGSSRRPVSVP